MVIYPRTIYITVGIIAISHRVGEYGLKLLKTKFKLHLLKCIISCNRL